MQKRPGVRLGSYRGAPIYLKNSWFVFMVLIVAGYGYNLAGWNSLTTAQGFIAAGVVAATLALGVFLHELAHAVVGYRRGLTVRSISLTIWGGQTSMSTGTPGTSIAVSLAGPLVNLLMAAGCELVWAATGSADFLGFALAAQVNLAIGIFNLLPAYPLDGGHALEAAVTRATGRRSTATRVTAYTGVALIALLAALAVLLQVWYSPFLLVATIALAYFLWSGASRYLTMLSQQASPHNPLTAAALLRPAQFVPASEPISSALARWDGSSYLLVQDRKSPAPLAVVDPLSLSAAQSLGNQPLAALARPLAPRPLPLSASQIDVMDHYNGYGYHLLPREIQQDSPIWAVTNAGQTVGVLCHRDITELITAAARVSDR